MSKDFTKFILAVGEIEQAKQVAIKALISLYPRPKDFKMLHDGYGYNGKLSEQEYFIQNQIRTDKIFEDYDSSDLFKTFKLIRELQEII